MTARGKWAAIFASVLILGTVWIWLSRPPASAQPQNLAPEPAVGRPAPDFTLTTLNGDTFTLSEYLGTPLVLNFWATWCGPCRREMPALQAAAIRYDGEALIVGIDQGEDASVVQPFVEEFALTFPIPMDTELAVADLYNVKGLPTTYFVDGDGIIRYVWSGEMNSVTLAEGISRIWP